jgi:hypothetical protein
MGKADFETFQSLRLTNIVIIMEIVGVNCRVRNVELYIGERGQHQDKRSWRRSEAWTKPQDVLWIAVFLNPLKAALGDLGRSGGYTCMPFVYTIVILQDYLHPQRKGY